MSYTIEDRNDNTDNIIKTVKVWTSMTIVYTTNKIHNSIGLSL